MENNVKRIKISLIVTTIILFVGLGYFVYESYMKIMAKQQVRKAMEEFKRKPLKSSNPLFNPLPETASDDVKMQRKLAMQKAAQEAPYLEIKDCKPNPLILKIKNKLNLIVRNSGNEKRYIIFEKKEYVVPAYGQTSISLEFTVGVGPHTYYWYACDLVKDAPSGIVWVIPSYNP